MIYTFRIAMNCFVWWCILLHQSLGKCTNTQKLDHNHTT